MNADIGPGDFVECIDDAVRGGEHCGRSVFGRQLLHVGVVYEVAYVVPGAAIDGGEDALVLVTFLNLRDPDGCLPCFSVSRFRPGRRPNSDFIDALKAPAPPVVRRTLEDA